MKLLADENIAAPLVRELRKTGVDVLYVGELAPGVTDDEVVDLVVEHGRLLLTEDKDFGELVYRMKRGLPGVILLRLPAGSWQTQWTRLERVLRRHGDKLDGRYTVVEPARVRSRPLRDGKS